VTKGLKGAGRRGAAVALLAAASALIAAAYAWAADTITASDDLSFGAAKYTIQQGERPTFQNDDAGVPHNVTAKRRIGGGPLFRTTNVIGPGSAQVRGAEYLTQGDYPFHCTIHPNMVATLHVSGGGTPVARPDVRVAILSTKLATLRGKGKALVRVRAKTKSDGVSLALKLGSRRLAWRSKLDLGSGQVRKLVLKLNRRARKRLAGRKRAKLKLIASVPFGARHTASKVLR
jgi:plastocyanin